MTYTPSTDRDLLRRTVRIVNLGLRHRWLIIGVPLLAGVVSVSLSLRQHRSYTAQGRFLTQGARPAGGGASLAAQFGINVGGAASDPSQTPEFYTDIITSRPILQGTAHANYTIALPGQASKRETLIDFFGSEDAAIDNLRGAIGSSISPKTGIVSFSVRSATPELAQAIAQQLLRELDLFNRQRRQSRSMAERRFTEGRLAAADSELKSAEAALQEFYTRNRGFERSPELKFQEERLTRESLRRQQLYATLAQAYEQAKIDEVRDTPVITVLEDPVVPKIGNPRGTISRAAVAILVALFLSIIVAVAIETLRGADLDSTDEFTEFKSLGNEFLSEIRNPTRAFRRRRPPVVT